MAISLLFHAFGVNFSESAEWSPLWPACGHSQARLRPTCVPTAFAPGCSLLPAQFDDDKMRALAKAFLWPLQPACQRFFRRAARRV